MSVCSESEFRSVVDVLWAMAVQVRLFPILQQIAEIKIFFRRLCYKLVIHASVKSRNFCEFVIAWKAISILVHN